MSILTNLTQAQINSSAKELDGKTLTRPALKVSDGTGTLYAVDVDLGLGAPVKNVPLVRGSERLLLAEVGTAVRLRRTGTGGWEVLGFTTQQPGTYFRYPVDLETFTLGSPLNVTLEGRVLTYDELHTFGTYGLIPYGATGIFQGGVLQEVKV